jgi:hypothetical protein
MTGEAAEAAVTIRRLPAECGGTFFLWVWGVVKKNARKPP